MLKNWIIWRLVFSSSGNGAPPSKRDNPFKSGTSGHPVFGDSILWGKVKLSLLQIT
jgi:hypothetical protein